MSDTVPQFQSRPDPGDFGWLVNTSRQQVVHFKPDAASGTTVWVSIRTYQYNPPRPPEPLTHRRVLRENAIDSWRMMLKRGWRPCHAPTR